MINVAKDCQPFATPQSEASASECKFADINISNEQLEEFAKDYDFKINPDFEQDQRRDLLRLLFKYHSCFARILSELRRFKNYELESTVKDSKPSFQRQYKLSQEDALECHRQINEILDCGIVEPSTTSKYESAMFTVKSLLVLDVLSLTYVE